MTSNLILLRDVTLVTPGGLQPHQSILIEHDRIRQVGPADQIKCPAGAVQVEAGGLVASPGLIELQINGAFGKDFTEEPDTLWDVARELPRYGVTAFLPTVITSPLETVDHAIRVIRQRPTGFLGAEPLGLHLEGPFLNPARKGAHNARYIRLPDPALVTGWSPQKGVRLVTLAPEMPGAIETIRALRAQGVIVSAGHSTATYEQALAGFDAGITYGTHLFNAMPPLEHRAPNLPGALLSTPEITVGLLTDGVHVHPAVINMIWAVKGPGGITVVTDAMAAMGMADGTYILGDYQVLVAGGTARLDNGTLAGSTITPDAALRNLMRFTGCSLGDALAAFTSTPARVLRLHERGAVAAGAIADLVLLTPEGMVQKTFGAGKLLYDAG